MQLRLAHQSFSSGASRFLEKSTASSFTALSCEHSRRKTCTEGRMVRPWKERDLARLLKRAVGNAPLLDETARVLGHPLGLIDPAEEVGNLAHTAQRSFGSRYRTNEWHPPLARQSDGQIASGVADDFSIRKQLFDSLRGPKRVQKRC